MNSSLEVLKKIYKPYKVTIKGNVVILNTTSGDFVVKESSKQDITLLFRYLQSRSFLNYPNIVDDTRSNIMVYQYIEDVKMPLEQKALDLIQVIGNLHNKTTFYKTTSEDDFKAIYDKINENIIYLENTYNNYYENFKKSSYMAPSNYAFMRNFYKIDAALKFSKSELDNWFSLVKNQKKKRVSLIHNHLTLEHFLKNEDGYLISWDNSRIDTPIMDLVLLYKNEYLNLNFSPILSKYESIVTLTEDEKKLFFILISIPSLVNFDKTEFINCENIRKMVDYIFITEELVRPYYTIEEEN